MPAANHSHMLLDGRYVVGDLLGVGGMGRVYAAEAPDHASVAIKVLDEAHAGDTGMIARLVEEARAARRVSHRNVVRVLDHGTTTDGVAFLVMERVAGQSLDKLVQNGGPLSLVRIRTIASQILAGIDAIHRAGLVHGDMKAGNVLIDELDRVTIIDFGLSRAPATVPVALGPELLSGTPGYMAPELIRGEPITFAADLYAVGVIVYEMLTGTTPFGGGTQSMIFERHLADELTQPSLRCPERTIPTDFENVILRALARDPSARYRDAARFAAALESSLPAGLPDRPSAAPVSLATDGPTRELIAPHARRFHGRAAVAHRS